MEGLYPLTLSYVMSTNWDAEQGVHLLINVQERKMLVPPVLHSKIATIIASIENFR